MYVYKKKKDFFFKKQSRANSLCQWCHGHLAITFQKRSTMFQNGSIPERRSSNSLVARLSSHLTSKSWGLEDSMSLAQSIRVFTRSTRRQASDVVSRWRPNIRQSCGQVPAVNVSYTTRHVKKITQNLTAVQKRNGPSISLIWKKIRKWRIMKAASIFCKSNRGYRDVKTA